MVLYAQEHNAESHGIEMSVSQEHNAQPHGIEMTISQ